MAQIEKNNGVWKLHGDMSISRIIELKADVFPVPKGGQLNIDFSAVTHVDTATVSFMFELLRAAGTSGCDLSFSKLPKNLLSLLSLYGVDGLIVDKT